MAGEAGGRGEKASPGPPEGEDARAREEAPVLTFLSLSPPRLAQPLSLVAHPHHQWSPPRASTVRPRRRRPSRKRASKSGAFIISFFFLPSRSPPPARRRGRFLSVGAGGGGRLHHARERARAVVPLFPAILGTPAFGEKNRRAGGEREGEAKGRARAQVRPSRLSWRAPLSSLANIRHSPRTPHSHSHRMKVHMTKSKGRAGKIVEIFYPEDGACCVFFWQERETRERKRGVVGGAEASQHPNAPPLSPPHISSYPTDKMPPMVVYKKHGKRACGREWRAPPLFVAHHPHPLCLLSVSSFSLFFSLPRPR